MKKLILAFIATICTVALSTAQERVVRQGQRGTAEERAKMEVENLQKTLSLNASQHDSILNYINSSNKDMQQFRSQGGEDREALFAKMKEFREKRTTKIKSFLTKEQVEKYDVLLKERENQRSQGGKRE